MIPVFSYAALGGKCRHCGSKISPVYPLVEALTGALFVALYARFSLDYTLLVGMALVSLLIVISLIDLSHMMIPNGLIIAGLAVGAAQLMATIFTGYFGDWTLYVIGFFAGGLPLLLINLFCVHVLKKKRSAAGISS